MEKKTKINATFRGKQHSLESNLVANELTLLYLETSE
jgi:hypothetical protein